MQHLRELGLNTTNASACWYKPDCDTEYFEMFGIFKKKELTSREECIPAYTLQDVLDVLPKEIKIDGRRYWPIIDMVEEWMGFYHEYFGEPSHIATFFFRDGAGLIDAAYEMLCWCIEHGFVPKRGAKPKGKPEPRTTVEVHNHYGITFHNCRLQGNRFTWRCCGNCRHFEGKNASYCKKRDLIVTPEMEPCEDWAEV